MEGFLGKTVGKYLIESEIGRGGMGVVYKGHQLTLNRTVAIKVLPPQMALDPDFLLRFQQEAQIIASLAHENIVYVYDIEESDGAYFIIMEYVEGQNLRKIVRHRRFTIEEVRSVGVAVARALDYAHEKGIVHRDVKSHNVMITTDGKVKLMDFGIARVVGSGIKTQTGAVLGTPEYMSPEQARSGEVTPQTDIYAMGVVLYELATGHLPFRGGDAFAIAFKHISEPPPPPSSIDPNVPPWLEAIILRALQKEPADRYASAGEMERELIRAEAAVGASSVTRYDAPVAVPASLVDQALPMGIGATPTPPSRPSFYTPTAAGTPLPTGTAPTAHPPIYPHSEPNVVPLWAKIVVGGAFGILLGLILYLFLPRSPQAPATVKGASTEVVSTDSLLGPSTDPSLLGVQEVKEEGLESSSLDPLQPDETIEDKWGNLEEEQKEVQEEQEATEKERPPYPEPMVETQDQAPYDLQPLEEPKPFKEPVKSTPPPPPPQPKVRLDNTFRCEEAAEFHVDPEDALIYVGGSLLGKADDWDGMGGGQAWEPGFGTYTVRLELEGYETKWIRVIFSEDAEEEECDIDTELHEP